MKIALPLIGKFLSIIVWFSTITLLVACPNANWGPSTYPNGLLTVLCLVYILVETARDKARPRVWKVHSSRLPHSRPVFVSSRSSRRHVGKLVPSQRKRECLKCLASLSTILARECQCLHSCILRFVHILLKVSTSTRHENINQALTSTVRTIPRWWLRGRNHQRVVSEEDRQNFLTNQRIQKRLYFSDLESHGLNLVTLLSYWQRMVVLPVHRDC